MQTLMRIWPACSMKVADRGLREGILYSLMTADNHLNKKMRKNQQNKKKVKAKTLKITLIFP